MAQELLSTNVPRAASKMRAATRKSYYELQYRDFFRRFPDARPADEADGVCLIVDTARDPKKNSDTISVKYYRTTAHYPRILS